MSEGLSEKFERFVPIFPHEIWPAVGGAIDHLPRLISVQLLTEFVDNVDESKVKRDFLSGWTCCVCRAESWQDRWLCKASQLKGMHCCSLGCLLRSKKGSLAKSVWTWDASSHVPIDIHKRHHCSNSGTHVWLLLSTASNLESPPFWRHQKVCEETGRSFFASNCR